MRRAEASIFAFRYDHHSRVAVGDKRWYTEKRFARNQHKKHLSNGSKVVAPFVPALLLRVDGLAIWSCGT